MDSSISQPSSRRRVGHPSRAPVAVGAERGEALEQRGVGVVDAVAEDVEVLVLVLHGRDLHGGDEPQARVPLGLGERLVQPVDRVVVGQREQLDAVGGGEPDDLGGRERPVGVDGVGLEIERRPHRVTCTG